MINFHYLQRKNRNSLHADAKGKGGFQPAVYTRVFEKGDSAYVPQRSALSTSWRFQNDGEDCTALCLEGDVSGNSTIRVELCRVPEP